MIEFVRHKRALSAIMGIAALLAGCAGGGSATEDAGEATAAGDLADMEPITLRAALPFPKAAPPARLFATWATEVEERTDGKVSFETYHDATLIPAAESLAGLSSGLADIGFVAASNHPSELPVANWVLGLTTPVTNADFPMSNFAGFPASAAIFNFAEPVVKEFHSHNIQPLLQMFASPFVLLCDEPVATPEDAAGKTVRTGGEPWKSEVEALGMTNEFLPPADLYEALQRGVVDCVLNAPGGIVTTGLAEVTKSTALIESGASSGAGIAFNKESWDALPSEVQRIMREAVAGASVQFLQTNLEEFGQAVKAAQDNGHVFTPVDQLNSVIIEQRKDVLDELMSNPTPGVDDPDRVLEQYRSYANEWMEFVESEMSVPTVDSTATTDERIDAYLTAGDGVDWNVYEQKFREFMDTIQK